MQRMVLMKMIKEITIRICESVRCLDQPEVEVQITHDFNFDLHFKHINEIT